MYSFDFKTCSADIIFEKISFCSDCALLTFLTMSCSSGHLGFYFKGFSGFRENVILLNIFQILGKMFYVKTCPVVISVLEFLPNQTLCRGINNGYVYFACY